MRHEESRFACLLSVPHPFCVHLPRRDLGSARGTHGSGGLAIPVEISPFAARIPVVIVFANIVPVRKSAVPMSLAPFQSEFRREHVKGSIELFSLALPLN